MITITPIAKAAAAKVHTVTSHPNAPPIVAHAPTLRPPVGIDGARPTVPPIAPPIPAPAAPQVKALSNP
ncbi:hypothetical protein SMU22_05290 [Streptococcus mutans 4SM1]|nr:hypothetical protein SMU22_05290 [Streptococcus mutans 4SM1]